MSLNKIITPEILNDEFYESLVHIARRPDVTSILEIGSSSGAGSTQALVEGIQSRSDRDTVNLYCMELSRERYIQLFSTYSKVGFVKAYNLSSVSIKDFPSETEVAFFYNTTKPILSITHRKLFLTGCIKTSNIFVNLDWTTTALNSSRHPTR